MLCSRATKNSREAIQGVMEVILAVVTCVWTCIGSPAFSSRFHTSRLPLSFPMKNTAGRVRDQHPTVHARSELGDTMMGPSWMLWKYKQANGVSVFNMHTVCYKQHIRRIRMDWRTHVKSPGKTLIFVFFLLILIQSNTQAGFELVAVFSAAAAESMWGLNVTMTPSCQMANFQPPVVKITSLKKGDRGTVFTNQLWMLKQLRGLVPWGEETDAGREHLCFICH